MRFKGKKLYPRKMPPMTYDNTEGDKVEFKYLGADGNEVHPAMAMRRLKVWFSKLRFGAVK